MIEIDIKTNLLEKCNIKIDDKITFISGENGSGKTSLLNMIAGLNNSYTGEIKLDDSSKLDNIVYITQFDELFSDLTIEQNIELLANLEKKAKCLELLDQLGFNLDMDTKVKKLSGGERKKLQIAIYLSFELKYAILDEPDNNLDKDSQEKLIKILKSDNINYIIVSHSLKDMFKENDFSEYQINNRKIELVSKSENKLFDSLENEITNKVTKNRKKIINKREFPKQILFLIIYIIIGITLVFQTFNYFYASNRIENTSKNGTYNESSALLYAPAFNKYFAPFGTKEYLKKIPLYFTESDKEKLEKSQYVKKVLPVNMNALVSGFYTDSEGNYTLDKSKLNDGMFIREEQLSIPNEILANVALSDYTNADKLLFGSLPMDNTNEVMIDKSLAEQVKKDKSVKNIEELIGKDLSLSMLSFDGNSEVNKTFKIVGITEPKVDNTSIYYAFNDNASDQENSYYYYENMDSDIVENDVKSKEPVIDAQDYKGYYQEGQEYYYGFYIELNDPKEMENFTKEIINYDKYIEIRSNYANDNINVNNYISSFTNKKIRAIILLVLSYVIVIIINFRVNNDMFKKIKKSLILSKYNEIEIMKFKTGLIKQLVYTIGASLIIMACIISFFFLKLNYLITLKNIIIIGIIFVILLITIFTNKKLREKS